MDAEVAKSLDTVPTELCAKVLSLVTIYTRMKVEMVSRALRPRAYLGLSSLGSFVSDPQESERFNFVTSLLRKPGLLPSLRKLSHTNPFGPNCSGDKALTGYKLLFSAENLTKVIILENLVTPTGPGSLPLNHLAHAPLKVLSYRARYSYYEFIDMSIFARWARTMRHLSLLAPSVKVLSDQHLKAADTIASTLVEHKFEALETLAIAIEDWTPLKPLTKLRELCVEGSDDLQRFIGLVDLKKSIELQLERNPPSIGLQLAIKTVGPDRIFESLMSKAIHGHRADIVKELLGKYNFDVTRKSRICSTSTPQVDKQYFYTSASSRTSKDPEVLLAIIKALKSPILKVSNRRETIFTVFMVEWNPIPAEWLQWAKTLFGEPWEFWRHKYSVDELLSPVLPVLLALVQRVDTSKIADRTKFLSDHPEKFGKLSLDVVCSSGCNALHYCRSVPDIALVTAWNLNPLQRDHFGYTAPECLANRGEGKVLSELLLVLSDKAFIASATPFVWGGLTMSIEQWTLDTAPDGHGRLINRLVSLLPKETWAPLVGVVVNTNLQINKANVIFLIHTYNGPHALDVHQAAVEALVGPFDILKWRAQYIPRIFPRIIDAPRPHLIVDHFSPRDTQIVLEAAKKRLGDVEFRRWLSVKNSRHQSIFQILPTPKHLEEIVEGLGVKLPLD